MQPLKGKVAVVAGATRGAGRGIARALGEAGATVYCTGRSVRGKPSPYKRPETIEETAEMVTAAGGKGIAVRIDHTVEADVRRFFARVAKEHGRLDVLADSVAGEDPTFEWHKPLAKIDVDQALRMMRQTVFSHLLTAKHAAPLTTRRGGLIVEVTEGDTFTGGDSIMRFLVKANLKLLAYVLANELRKKRIAVVSITPGWLRSESMLEHFKVTEDNWRDGGKKDPNFLESESPLFVGRAVAALAADPEVMDLSGDVTSSWELARRYGFTDADGRCPDVAKFFARIAPTMPWFQEGFRREARWLTKLARRSQRYGGKASARKTSKPAGQTCGSFS
jgi:NAD(P)-dependent dehydrogenase (short-subunit alcohol dehydrogenase family)